MELFININYHLFYYACNILSSTCKTSTNTIGWHISKHSMMPKPLFVPLHLGQRVTTWAIHRVNWRMVTKRHLVLRGMLHKSLFKFSCQPLRIVIDLDLLMSLVLPCNIWRIYYLFVHELRDAWLYCLR